MGEFNINNLITKDVKTIENGGGEAPRKGGRPALKNKKSEKIMAYFTEEEKQKIQEVADSKNLSISKFVALCTLEIVEQSKG